MLNLMFSLNKKGNRPVMLDSYNAKYHATFFKQKCF